MGGQSRNGLAVRYNRRQMRKYYEAAVNAAPEICSVKPVPRRDVIEVVNELDEYGVDIINTLKEGELKHRVGPAFMELDHPMRDDFINWLIMVADEYELECETIHLTASILDRFLCKMSVTTDDIELVSITALFVAAKYEETAPLEVNALLKYTDATMEQIFQMERTILQVVQFDLCVPTASVFLGAFSTANESSDEIKYLAQYIADLSLIDGEQYSSHLPSEIAAASLALAHLYLQDPIWNLEALVGYSVHKLRNLIVMLAKSLAASGTHSYDSLYNKYSHPNYKSVAQYSFDVYRDLIERANF